MTFKFNFKNDKYLNDIEDIEHEFDSEELKADGKTVKTQITMYGPIGSSWFGDSTSAKDVERILKDNESEEIIINLNSGGGDAFDGIAIYNQLKNHPAKVTVHVDGFAASAASIIAMAADKLIMNTGTMMMIHEAATFAIGTKKEMKAVLNALEGLDTSLADIYMTRFKGERSEIETFIENETWFTVDEAVAIGLADEIKETDGAEDSTTDSEEFKNNVLSRFQSSYLEMSASADSKGKIPRNKKNILSAFQRP